MACVTYSYSFFQKIRTLPLRATAALVLTGQVQPAALRQAWRGPPFPMLGPGEAERAGNCWCSQEPC